MSHFMLYDCSVYNSKPFAISFGFIVPLIQPAKRYGDIDVVVQQRFHNKLLQTFVYGTCRYSIAPPISTNALQSPTPSTSLQRLPPRPTIPTRHTPTQPQRLPHSANSLPNLPRAPIPVPIINLLPLPKHEYISLRLRDHARFRRPLPLVFPSLH